MKRDIPSRGGRQITEIRELRNYLEGIASDLQDQLATFETEPAHGRIYPASSINYDGESGHIQTASSPGYWGGIWSLTCCKHDMRKEKYFDYFRKDQPGVLRPTEPLFVFTCGGKEGSDRPENSLTKRRWVASAALVTHAFRTMEDYGRFLLEQGEAAWKPRFSTRGDADKLSWSRQYGDCHALIEDGEVSGVGTPYPEHDHVSDSGTVSCGCDFRVDREYDHVYQKDIDSDRLKFVSTSDYWISWSEPNFYWSVGNGPDRYGGGQPMLAYASTDGSKQRTVLSELRGVL